jgi:Phosphoglucose isomerase
MPIGETPEWRARINPFDQCDVELCKVMANALAPELQSDQAPHDADSPTNALIRLLRGTPKRERGPDPESPAPWPGVPRDEPLAHVTTTQR